MCSIHVAQVHSLRHDRFCIDFLELRLAVVNADLNVVTIRLGAIPASSHNYDGDAPLQRKFMKHIEVCKT